jgi:hypothetical protein
MIINQLNSQVKMLPMIEDTYEDETTNNDMMATTSNYAAPPLENLWDPIMTKRNNKPTKTAATSTALALPSSGGDSVGLNRSSRSARNSNNQVALVQRFVYHF